MAKAELASNDPPASSARPSTSEATCPTCGKSVDPLRAGHVALLGERFHYFCSQTCSAQFLEPHHSRLTEETREPPAVAERPTPTPSPSVRSLVLPARPARQLVTREVHVVTDERRDHEERNQSLLVRPVHRAPIAAPSAPAPWLGFLLTLCALSASLIGASSARIGDHGSDVALGAILCALALEIVQRARTRTRPTLQSVIAFAPLLAAVGIAVYAAHEEPAPAALSTVGLLLFGYVALRALSARLARETSHEVQTLLRAIAGKTHEVGEVIELHAPTFVPVDGVIVSGHGELRPNGVRGAAQPVSAGELVFAGNKLVVGTLEVRAQQVGDERALVRLFGEGTLHRMWPQRYTVIERVVAVGTLLAAITVGLFAWVSREEPWHPFLLATTVAGVVGMLYGLHLPRLLWARGVLAAIEHGVMFPSFATCDRTSFVEQLVLAGRGVVFSGAPQFVDLVWFGADHDRELILAEIAGAEARATHPLGICLHTALVSRGVEPGAMRGIEEKPGLGVVARTRANAQLIVGNRELLLRNAISMAGVEARALELESERREVLYVARGGRLCAFAVFEDSLCEGSFAAVQALLAAGIEPIMVSGSSQTVCEAAARSLEIDHVRSEVLPEERAQVVRSLIESGRVVGMVGGVPRDEDALLEADVGMAFGSALSRAPGVLVRARRADLEAITHVLVSLRRVRELTASMMRIALAPPLVIGLVTGFGLCPPVLLPSSGLLGLAVALWVGRSWLFSAQNPLPKPAVAE